MNLKTRLGEREFDLEIRREEGNGFRIRIDDREYRLDLTESETNLYSLLVDDRSYEVLVRPDGETINVDLAGRRYEVTIEDPMAALAGGSRFSVGGTQVIRSVMAGKVLEVMASEGDRVAQGDPLLVIEAMKMENEIRAPKDGIVTAVRVSPGDAVESGAELAILE